MQDSREKRQKQKQISGPLKIKLKRTENGFKSEHLNEKNIEKTNEDLLLKFEKAVHGCRTDLRDPKKEGLNILINKTQNGFDTNRRKCEEKSLKNYGEISFSSRKRSFNSDKENPPLGQECLIPRPLKIQKREILQKKRDSNEQQENRLNSIPRQLTIPMKEIGEQKIASYRSEQRENKPQLKYEDISSCSEDENYCPRTVTPPSASSDSSNSQPSKQTSRIYYPCTTPIGPLPIRIEEAQFQYEDLTTIDVSAYLGN